MTLASGLYWEAHGPVDAPPLILSSGLGGSAGYWTPNLPALAERHRVILYDHRGTGRSDPAIPDPTTVADLADDILALMAALELPRADFVGHAAGGVAGLAFALKTPERRGRLVVVNGWAAPDPHFGRCFDVRLTMLRNSGARAYVHAQPIFLYPAQWIADHAAELDGEEDAQVAAFPAVATVEARIAALRAFDVARLLDQIAVPTLALCAADDMLVPASRSAEIAAGVPGARLATMAWGGHACNVTDPQGFAARVLAFLDA